METLVINAGAFQVDGKLSIKNMTIYKTSDWTSCIIKQNNRVYKNIYAEDLIASVPYAIEIEKFQGLPSLLFNHMIIYQHDCWFDYQLEFILSKPLTNEGEKFFEYNA